MVIVAKKTNNLYLASYIYDREWHNSNPDLKIYELEVPKASMPVLV